MTDEYWKHVSILAKCMLDLIYELDTNDWAVIIEAAEKKVKFVLTDDMIDDAYDLIIEQAMSINGVSNKRILENLGFTVH